MVGFSGIWGSQAAAGGERVTNAIASASRQTGVDFAYLMGQAQIESSMNPNAKARTSSATGLYQFLDQSWLAVMNNHGAEHGMEWASNAIQQGSNGRYYVADPAVRQQILDLRKHPETASVMAAEFASDNRAYLESRTGRPAESVDLYLAHFLGAGGAAKFLTASANNPDASGAALFPAAARANRSIFYDRQGNARSLSDIRQSFAQKLNSGAQGANVQFAGGYDDYAMPSGSTMVQPADYLRIAQARLGMQGESGAGSNDDDVTSHSPGWADTSGETQAALPRNEAARLAYLMLATLGR
ncbi:MAG: transglycosylase SLT domain-containing protein [Sphingobium sp.]